MVGQERKRDPHAGNTKHRGIYSWLREDSLDFFITLICRFCITLISYSNEKDLFNLQLMFVYLGLIL